LNKQHTLLIVEDDARLRELTADYLRQHSYHVIALEDGTEVSSVLSHSPVDLVILDVMLPGDDGFVLCRSIREVFDGPLLFLTAKTDLTDELQGFELGADDYITKPVEPSVLLARIQALLRRTSSKDDTQSAAMNFGQLSIDRLARRVTLDQEQVVLTSHEFDLLVLLADNAGSVVERDRIYNELIGREYDGLDRSADVRISRLRKKLKDNAQQPYRIKTIWGKGFFFVADAWC